MCAHMCVGTSLLLCLGGREHLREEKQGRSEVTTYEGHSGKGGAQLGAGVCSETQAVATAHVLTCFSPHWCCAPVYLAW